MTYLCYTYNESAVVSVVNLALSEGIDNWHIIAEQINKAGYQTKGGKVRDCGIKIFIQHGSVTKILLAN